MYKSRKGLTLLEMMIAISIMAVVFAAILPQFKNINNSWASRQENTENLQVGRIVTSHLRDHIDVAKSIIAVSDPDDDDGFLEYEDIDGITYRYEISGRNLLFGPVGNMAILAKSVAELEFECYAIDDLDTKITDVAQIRFVEAEIEIDKPSGSSETLAVSVYLRMGGSITSGIVGWWKLDEAFGFVAADSSGNDNHGILGDMAGNEWTGGVLAGALEFDGIDDHIAGIGDCPTGNYTVTGWAKDTGPASGSSKWSVLYSAEQEIWLGVDRGDPAQLWLDAGGNGKGAKTAAGAWTRDSWHHIAAIWDGIDPHIYIDGVDMPITIYGIPENAEAKPAVIGAYSNRTDDKNWYGPLDDIRVYGYALSASEIGQLANILRYREFSEAKAATDATSITIPTPAGTNKDDLLIAAVATDGSTSVSLSPPSGEGWTKINTGNYVGRVSLGAWWKLADSSESPTHQFTWSGPEQAYGWMMRFTGHDPVDPINVYASAGSTSSNPTSPSVTTTVDNGIVLRLGAFDEGDIINDAPGLAGHTAITMDASSGSSTTEAMEITKEITGGKKITISMPSIRPDGDLYLAQIALEGGAIFKIIPTGWTQINDIENSGNIHFASYWKIGSSEPATYTWEVASSKRSIGIIHRISGVDTANPINASGNDKGDSFKPTAPSVTTSVDKCLILRMYGAEGNAQLSTYWPPATTPIFQDDSAGKVVSAAAYENLFSAGSTGTGEFSMAGKKKWIAMTVAVTPASGGDVDSVSGGAGYVKQSLSGNSGTSTFSLTASEESRTITIGIAQDPASGGSLMP